MTIRCQHISSRKRPSKRWLVKAKFEISEVSECSILSLILKSKTRKTRKYFEDLQTSKISFYLRKRGFSEVSQFSILPLLLKSKTRKTRKYVQDFNFKKRVLFNGVGNFWVFWDFDFYTYNEIENLENLKIFGDANLFYLRTFVNCRNQHHLCALKVCCSYKDNLIWNVRKKITSLIPGENCI